MSSWNIKPIGKPWQLEECAHVELMESGPVRCIYRITHKYKDSTFIRDLAIYAELPRLDVEMAADWHGRDLWVRVLFPTAVENGAATFHVPYGAKERPANGNEVPAITWFDLSNENAGLSLLDNAKYGCSVDGATLTLSLLRNPSSPKCPDPNPDEGWHQFTYSLYPHAGDWKVARSMRQGAQFNQALLGYVKPKQDRSGKLPLEFSFVQCAPENVMVTALKRAENSNDLILRFVEFHGKVAQAKVTLPRTIKSVKTVNLLENEMVGDVSVNGRQIQLTVRPYQIKSLRIRL